MRAFITDFGCGSEPVLALRMAKMGASIEYAAFSLDVLALAVDITPGTNQR